jgi:hypothetical protein
MEHIPKTSRKKFLLWSATVLSSLTVLKFIPRNKQGKAGTVKMLTQDGKLVEVDAEKLPGGKGKKITDEQLKTWVNQTQD